MKNKKSKRIKNLRKQIAEKKKLHKKALESLTLWKSPFLTLKFFILEVTTQLKTLINYTLHHYFITLFITMPIFTLFLLNFISGPHQFYYALYKQDVEDFAKWMFLGILSSVGLGTGLHTFLLYLGPHIAKVTLAAGECGSVGFSIHGNRAFICNVGENLGVSFWEIFRKVNFAAFAWGLGTAIGELPPYFVARAARLTGEKLENLNEFQEEASKLNSITKFFKNLVDTLMGKNKFIAILLLASIPNPLFDLAGLTCGYSLVPFATFFGATIIGKAFIKAHFQCILIISLFRNETLDFVIGFLDNIPFLKGKVKHYIETERSKFHPTLTKSKRITSKSWFKIIWDAFLIGMVTWFIISIVHSTAQSRLADEQKKELDKLEEQQKTK